MHRCLTLILASFLAVSGLVAGAHAERRVALVIGNGSYKNTIELPNALNDGPAVAASLRRLGFEVVEGVDLTHAQMNAKMKEFARQLNGAEVGLFFYAGHGMQVAGENYLIPVDAALKQIGDLDYETVKVDSVLKQMFRETKIKIVLLDSCRDNPLANELSRSLGPRTRSAGSPASGLAQIDTAGASGTVIAFATAPGGVALDGKGSHSPFSQALLEHLETPGLDIDLVMKRVRGQVSRSTGERQQPWTNSSLNGEFYLQKAGQPASQSTVMAALPPQAQGGDPASAPEVERALPSDDSMARRERELWDTAERSKKPEDYRAYLAAFPDGKYAPTARRLSEPRPAEAKSTTKETASEDVRSQKADAGTERSMKLSPESVRDVHTRLALLSHGPGAIRTSFASASRKALASWQSSAGLVPTGYLNGGQLELLNRQSQPLYDAWVQQGRPELASLQSADGDGSGDRQPAPARAQRQQSDGGSGRGGGNPAAGAAEALGVARQIIGRGVPRLPGF